MPRGGFRPADTLNRVAQPRIGITWSPRQGLLPYYALYVAAVEAAGGEPVPLESIPGGPGAERAAAIVDDIDGLLVPGGWDVDPPLYGETRLLVTPEVDVPLDLTEIALVRAAAARPIPILGICRGQQVINVALGGSLHQHIDGHDMEGQPYDLLAHAIEIAPGSELFLAAGTDSVMVNSLHHQAVKDLAPGLQITARSPDGSIEGVESGDAMIVAVQCHPEELIAGQPWASSLFQRFLDRVAVHAGDGAVAGTPTGSRPARR
jgi:putative glutamine amidotransferase